MTVHEQARAHEEQAGALGAAPMAPQDPGALTEKGDPSMTDRPLSIHDPMAANHDLLASLDRALAAVERMIVGVGAHQWSHPTPCTEWDVRQVVDHLISGNLNV